MIKINAETAAASLQLDWDIANRHDMYIAAGGRSKYREQCAVDAWQTVINKLETLYRFALDAVDANGDDFRDLQTLISLASNRQMMI